MGTIAGKFHQNSLKLREELRRQYLLLKKLLKVHISGKNQHDLDKICTSSGHGNNNWKVSSKYLENCRRSCGDKIVSMDGRNDGRTDEGRTDGRTNPLL